ncbi:MAG: hypothetical protein M3N53_01450 [Actinomycetota bacterium]|nr:hypothetical protein [Actinomycetota bacterium]
MTFDWKNPPGAPAARRALKGPVKKILTSFLVGVISVGVAWAGAGLVPVNDLTGELGTTEQVPGATNPKRSHVSDGRVAAGFSAEDLAAGQLLAGAAKVSLRPTPEAYQEQFPGARWETDPKKCKTLTDEQGFQEGLQDADDLRVRWAENTDCIYMGGYGIGPMFPIVAWDDEYGLYSRSIAMSDGSETLVLTLLDAVYWEAHYDNLCKGCGFIDLAQSLSKQTGLAPESFVFASTHSHTSPDFIGGWGGVPRWYMQQTTDAMQTSVQAALASMQPAVLETGEVIARQFNGERRDFYRSAEDDGVSWFRLVAASDQPTTETCSNPGGAAAPAAKPICEPADSGTAIATVGAYAAHPVTADAGAGIGDADFPGVFAKRVEESFGGVGMFVQTGLGNMSPRGGKVEMGTGLAQQIPAMGTGRLVENPNITIGRRFWDQPVTNVPLGHLGAAGVFDRTFNKTPAAISVGKSKYENKQCHSASHISVRTSVSAAKIGPLWITGGPGEVFSNLTNTIEERNPGGVTMALGLVNDGLGYIIQSFETDHVGRQGVGFVGTADVPDQSPVGPGQPLLGLSEYEDAYSIDHCFGDAVLEYTIQLLGQI